MHYCDGAALLPASAFESHTSEGAEENTIMRPRAVEES